MTDILFVRPADDSAAITAGTWGSALLQKVPVACSSTDLSGSSNTDRQSIDRELKSGIRNLFWFGHGTDTELVSNGAAIIDAANLRRLQSGIVVAIACHAGRSLGPATLNVKSVKAFLGFDDEVLIPLVFPLPMGNAVVQGLSCLFEDNHEIQCAADKLRLRFEDAVQDYKTNGQAYGMTPDETRTAWLFAKSNQYSVTLHGDLSAKIS